MKLTWIWGYFGDKLVWADKERDAWRLLDNAL